MYGWTKGILIGLLISLGNICMVKLKFKYTSTGAHIRHGHQQERYLPGIVTGALPNKLKKWQSLE